MIRLRVLGSVELLGSSGRALSAALAQPKRLALLIYLRAAAPSFVRRDTLLALLWPELDDQHARNALSQATRFLRQQLSEPSVVISRGANELGVDPSKLWYDVSAFRDAIEGGRREDALALYRGDFLEGFHSDDSADFEQWADRERRALRSAAANAARALAADRSRDERFTTAVANARRAVELSDLDERAVRELLLLLDRLGDRAGAIAAYDTLAHHLASQFGAEPAPETRAVIDQIRRRDAASAPPSASAPNDRIGGLRILREVGRGGMSTVYLAKDDKHDREVAVKVLRAESALSLPLEAFIDETRIMGRLTHPNILPLIDSGAARGR
jgi:DNA-binding SARP family transcriptional activator